MPPSGTTTPFDRVHVGDHRVEREGLVGRQAGVHGLEAEQPHAARSSSKKRRDRRAEPAEPAEPDQLERRRERAEQVERRVVVPVDEVRHLELVELGEPVAEAVERRGLGRRRRSRAISSAIASRPWRTRISLPSAKQARYIGSTGRSVSSRSIVGADRGEAALDEVGHREHGRPGVEPVAAEARACPARPPGTSRRLDHRDVVPRRRQVAGGREPDSPAPTTTTRGMSLTPAGTRRSRPG